MAKKPDVYDTVIIGAGPTGLSAAMYAGRLNLKTLVLGASSGTELPIGGVITLTEIVENYPGFKRLTGPELAEKLKDHALDYSERVEIKEERVTSVKKEKNHFDIKTEKGNQYISKTIIFASGTKWRKLPMKGAKEFENKGVHYCALCDGPLFRDKIIGVVGGSDTAAKEALLLSEYGKKVYIIYRGEKIRPEPVNAKRVKKNKKIEVLTNTNIVEIKGSKFVEMVVLDREHNGSKELKMDAVFGAIGSIPLSDLAKQLGVETNKNNEININRESKTNIPGVFAAGDVVDTVFKQAIVGAAEGVHAAHSAYTYINENEFVTTFDDEVYREHKK